MADMKVQKNMQKLEKGIKKIQNVTKKKIDSVSYKKVNPAYNEKVNPAYNEKVDVKSKENHDVKSKENHDEKPKKKTGSIFTKLVKHPKKQAIEPITSPVNGQATNFGSKDKIIIIALGGNSLIRKGERGTVKEHLKNLDHSMEQVAKLVKAGYRVILTHGNGPQVGNILIQQEATKGTAPGMPLFACVAESQGLIGYLIQESLYNKLHSIGIQIPVVTVITQVLVDRADPAFENPTKPVGPYYQNDVYLPAHWHVIETLRGVRRVVASPEPKQIIEAEAIKDLSRNAVVIACGGGGIPVIQDKTHSSGKRMPGLFGVDAVIDKDLSSSLLASEVNAGLLVILTDVEGVYSDFNDQKKARLLKRLNANHARKMLDEGQFSRGTMEPKIRAALNFLESGGKKVLIAGIDNLSESLKGKAGTIIEE